MTLFRQQDSWAKMTSPGGKLTSLGCHQTKNVNKAEELIYLSINIGLYVTSVYQKPEMVTTKVSKEDFGWSFITNRREPRGCLGRVFNYKFGSFTDNTKIAQPENGHF
jgi:hypothetical protein